MYKINISPLAFEDLEDIRAYIGEELQNETAAENIVKLIVKQIRILERNPLIGGPLSARINIETNYRYLVCKKYLVFYYVDKTNVYVSRVIYGKRDYVKILFGNSLENHKAPEDTKDV